MPDYGIKGPSEGPGLLDWSWAVERLTNSHDYWVATTWPDGRPHVTPVWGVWLDDALWFSCGHRSRKARNLTRDPRCSITTDNAYEPVVIDGVAAFRSTLDDARRFTDASNAKYEVDYDVGFYAANALFAVTQRSVFALDQRDFAGTPTVWTYSTE